MWLRLRHLSPGADHIFRLRFNLEFRLRFDIEIVLEPIPLRRWIKPIPRPLPDTGRGGFVFRYLLLLYSLRLLVGVFGEGVEGEEEGQEANQDRGCKTHDREFLKTNANHGLTPHARVSVQIAFSNWLSFIPFRSR